MTSERTPEQAFAAALSALQGEAPRIGKTQTANAGSYSYAYSDLADILHIMAPLLARHGLGWTARPMTADGGAFILRYALVHVDGHRDEGDYPLPDPTKFPPQQLGSAITYARRYAFCALTGIAPGGDDDDAQAAQHTHTGTRADTPPPRDDARTTQVQRVVAAGKVLSLGVPELRARYHEWSQGESLNDADSPALSEFAAALESEIAELDKTEAAS